MRPYMSMYMHTYVCTNVFSFQFPQPRIPTTTTATNVSKDHHCTRPRFEHDNFVRNDACLHRDAGTIPSQRHVQFHPLTAIRWCVLSSVIAEAYLADIVSMRRIPGNFRQSEGGTRCARASRSWHGEGGDFIFRISFSPIFIFLIRA